jgi:hypothetical protein
MAACDRSRNYHGDGTLTDMGPGTASARYVVDLGQIDLGEAGRQDFKLVGLPSVEFTAGLRPAYGSGCDAYLSTNVRLTVKDENGEVVIDEEGPLSSWTSSSGLIYRRGAERREPRSQGTVELVRTGVRSAGGWGTYFTPRTATTYLADFEVLGSQGKTSCLSRLVLLGGGWK